jgi:hypothetical protein
MSVKKEYKCDLCKTIKVKKELLCFYWNSVEIPQSYALNMNLDKSDNHICFDCIGVIKKDKVNPN